MAGPQKETNDARQAESGHGGRYVLGISLVLTAIVLVAVGWAFSNRPDTRFVHDKATPEQTNPPYGIKKEDPDKLGVKPENEPLPTGNAPDTVPQSRTDSSQ